MRRLTEPSHLDLCCLQKPIIIACGSERVVTLSQTSVNTNEHISSLGDYKNLIWVQIQYRTFRLGEMPGPIGTETLPRFRSAQAPRWLETPISNPYTYKILFLAYYNFFLSFLFMFVFCFIVIYRWLCFMNRITASVHHRVCTNVITLLLSGQIAPHHK